MGTGTGATDADLAGGSGSTKLDDAVADQRAIYTPGDMGAVHSVARAVRIVSN